MFEREHGDSLDEVIMAVEMRDRGTVGCCYYVAREQILYMVRSNQIPAITSDLLMQMADVDRGGVEVMDTRKCWHKMTLPNRNAKETQLSYKYGLPWSYYHCEPTKVWKNASIQRGEVGAPFMEMVSNSLSTRLPAHAPLL